MIDYVLTAAVGISASVGALVSAAPAWQKHTLDEGTGWQKGGSIAWQLYDRNGEPKEGKKEAPGYTGLEF